MYQENVIRPHEIIAFDMYFASLSSMQVHPGSGTKEHRTLTFKECRDKAMEMIMLRRELLEGAE